MAHEFVEEINKGGSEIPPNSLPSSAEELNFLQRLADEFPKILDFAEKTYEEPKGGEKFDKNAAIQKAKEDNEKLKSFIQQERKKHGYSSRPTNKPNSPSNIQQIQSLQNEINSLTQKIKKLANQIAELKKNQDTNPKDQSTHQEIQQKIATLQNQKDQVQKTLKQKQSQQERIKQQANIQPSEKGFNWLYIVIPGAVLLVVMGIIIAYLAGKRSKNN